jgi:hypothetical protein
MHEPKRGESGQVAQTSNARIRLMPSSDCSDRAVFVNVIQQRKNGDGLLLRLPLALQENNGRAAGSCLEQVLF